MKEKEKEIVKDFLIDYIISFKPCVATYTEDKWLKIFCEKRLTTFLEVEKELIEKKTGINLDNQKTLKEFKIIYKEMFMEEMHDHITQLKKIKDEEERELYKAKCVKRKSQDDENIKKKKKRK
jgi:hypothetical protein